MPPASVYIEESPHAGIGIPRLLAFVRQFMRPYAIAILLTMLLALCVLATDLILPAAS
jgi:hypothetical protein